jgi:hypothetical protein
MRGILFAAFAGAVVTVANAQQLPAYCTNPAYIPPVPQGAALRQVHVSLPQWDGDHPAWFEKQNEKGAGNWKWGLQAGAGN